jgi:hypothetical protein
MAYFKILCLGLIGILVFFGGYAYLRAQGGVGTAPNATPAGMEDIQYPFEKGGGLVNVSIGDVFMGVGMLVGERKKGDVQTTLTGSLNFELTSPKAQARLQVDRIRLIERTAAGAQGRVFEPSRIYDGAMEKGLAPELEFPKEKGMLPFAWENGESDCVFFVFSDIPSEVAQGDLVITYNGKFPGKKHLAYFEDRHSVKQKAYLRGG